MRKRSTLYYVPKLKKVLDNIFMLIYNVRVRLEYLRKVAFGVSGKEMLCLGWEQCSG